NCEESRLEFAGGRDYLLVVDDEDTRPRRLGKLQEWLAALLGRAIQKDEGDAGKLLDLVRPVRLEGDGRDDDAGFAPASNNVDCEYRQGLKGLPKTHVIAEQEALHASQLPNALELMGVVLDFILHPGLE